MRVYVFIAGRPTNLQVFIGSMTRYASKSGNLQIREVFVLAENQERARAKANGHYPGWMLQSCTSLESVPWIGVIMLNEDCPEVAEVREWLLKNVEPGPSINEDI